jgi:asparagine synthase (glutamine-hydrolysing)
LSRLNGMFAFVYHDTRTGKILAARDRFNIKPLVYTHINGGVAFASEAKQLLAAGLVEPRANNHAISLFLQHNALNHGPDTFFEGIQELRGGEMAVVDTATGEMQISRWYDISDHTSPIQVNYDEAVSEVRRLLIQSIQRHHQADVPLGSCLSGGIDSSSIVSLSRTLFPDRPLTSITTFSRHKGYDETPFAQAIIDVNQIDSIKVEVDTQAVWGLQVQTELGYYEDQPTPSGSMYNEYHVFKAAHEHGIKVMLDGQGADEYFGGYGEFWFAAQIDLLRSGRIGAFVEGLRENRNTSGRNLRQEIITFFRNMYSLRDTGTQRLGPHQVTWLRAPTDRRPLPPFQFNKISVEEMMYTSIPYQLYSEDRNSMRWSIESRVPFLDHELVEYVMKLPVQYRVGVGFRKRVLRDAVPELPVAVSQRKDKVGFASPDALALREVLPVARDSLEQALTHFGHMVDAEAVRQGFDQMTDCHAWYDPVFLRLIALEGWRAAHNPAM